MLKHVGFFASRVTALTIGTLLTASREVMAQSDNENNSPSTGAYIALALPILVAIGISIELIRTQNTPPTPQPPRDPQAIDAMQAGRRPPVVVNEPTATANQTHIITIRSLRP